MQPSLLLLTAFAALLTGAVTGCAGRADESAVHAPHHDESLVLIGVNGLVCNFCATNIDKTLDRTPGVRAVYVNLAAKAVLIRVDPNAAPDDATLRAIVADAGFEAREIRRETGDFNAEKLRIKESAPKE